MISQLSNNWFLSKFDTQLNKSTLGVVEIDESLYKTREHDLIFYLWRFFGFEFDIHLVRFLQFLQLLL